MKAQEPFPGEPEMSGYMTAYSVRNGINTSIPVGSVDKLAVQTTFRAPNGLVCFQVQS